MTVGPQFYSGSSWYLVYILLYLPLLSTSTYIHYTVCPRGSDPFYIITYYIKWGHHLDRRYLLCVQEVVNSIYIMSYYINWINYLLDTRYCLSKKSWSILYSKLLYKMSQDFLDIKYTPYLYGRQDPEPPVPLGDQCCYPQGHPLRYPAAVNSTWIKNLLLKIFLSWRC